VRHARQENVIGEACLPGHLRSAVHPAARYADDTQAFSIRPRILGLRRLHRFLLFCHLISQNHFTATCCATLFD